MRLSPHFLFLELAVGGLGEIRVDEAVELAVHHRLDVAGLIVRAVVLHQLIGHEHVRPDLAAPLDLELYAL